ncbi:MULTISPECIES: hypothetical protein [Grimontia]|uniref:Uncharacterized protein n=1 Tax=Grimontia marina TaxID=646534 RepID=A0A128FH54_9GAMM|nr:MULTISPECIES: hypothetical protein [Grimontia]WRV98328.1 hypothetical protein VP504_02515 [Grimontia sp. NTOU-MAR1]CZF86133.1 hypothetical protein GMA8713_04166 [Grimontia marina]
MMKKLVSAVVFAALSSSALAFVETESIKAEAIETGRDSVIFKETNQMWGGTCPSGGRLMIDTGPTEQAWLKLALTARAEMGLTLVADGMCGGQEIHVNLLYLIF